MRRTILTAVAFLLLASCYGTRFVDPESVGRGPTRRGLVPTSCREISRSRCDTSRCRGGNMDYVTIRCASGDYNRCQINTGCSR